MLVSMGLLLVTRMGVFMGAVIPGLMCMVVGRGSRSVAVLMLVLVGMGMTVCYPLVGVWVFMHMAMLVLMLVAVNVFSFHGCLLSKMKFILTI